LIGFGTPKGYFYLDSVQIFVFALGRKVFSMIFVEMKSDSGGKFVGVQITVERC